MEISITRDSSTPLHEQLLNQLRYLILSGVWTPGDILPSETELQRQLEISRSTVRQAFSNAEAQGLIERVPGKGTFVTRSPTGKPDSHLIGYVTCFSFRHLQSQLLGGAENVVSNKWSPTWRGGPHRVAGARFHSLTCNLLSHREGL